MSAYLISTYNELSCLSWRTRTKTFATIRKVACADPGFVSRTPAWYLLEACWPLARYVDSNQLRYSHHEQATRITNQTGPERMFLEGGWSGSYSGTIITSIDMVSARVEKVCQAEGVEEVRGEQSCLGRSSSVRSEASLGPSRQILDSVGEPGR